MIRITIYILRNKTPKKVNSLMVERDQLAKSDIFHLSTSNDSIALSLFSDWVSKKKLFVCVETFLEMSFQPRPLFLNIRTKNLI